jgi:hypothetical protein
LFLLKVRAQEEACPVAAWPQDGSLLKTARKAVIFIVFIEGQSPREGLSGSGQNTHSVIPCPRKGVCCLVNQKLPMLDFHFSDSFIWF